MPTSETWRWAGWRQGAVSEPEPVTVRAAELERGAEEHVGHLRRIAADDWLLPTAEELEAHTHAWEIRAFGPSSMPV